MADQVFKTVQQQFSLPQTLKLIGYVILTTSFLMMTFIWQYNMNMDKGNGKINQEFGKFRGCPCKGDKIWKTKVEDKS